MKAPARKGMSLPLETVVLLILSAIVLGALLAFFLSAFTPSQRETDIMRQQMAICQEIQAKGCLSAPQELIGKLQAQKVCTLPGKSDSRPACSGATAEDCVKSCCRIFCG
jgi:hypothetical protein